MGFSLSLCSPPVQLVLKPPKVSRRDVAMMDRSRVALCIFTFLFLSLNPVGSLMSRGMGGTGTAGTTGHTGASGTGRTIMSVKNGGTELALASVGT